MINALKQISLITTILIAASLTTTANAQSQCSGLSSSACSSKSSECTWRKSSVNKNGTKTKAHCRALPGKSKASSKSKTSTKKTAKKTTKKTTKKNTSTTKKKGNGS